MQGASDGPRTYVLLSFLEKENGFLWLHLKMVVISTFVKEARTTLHGKHAH